MERLSPKALLVARIISKLSNTTPVRYFARRNAAAASISARKRTSTRRTISQAGGDSIRIRSPPMTSSSKKPQANATSGFFAQRVTRARLSSTARTLSSHAAYCRRASTTDGLDPDLPSSRERSKRSSRASSRVAWVSRVFKDTGARHSCAGEGVRRAGAPSEKRAKILLKPARNEEPPTRHRDCGSPLRAPPRTAADAWSEAERAWRGAVGEKGVPGKNLERTVRLRDAIGEYTPSALRRPSGSLPGPSEARRSLPDWSPSGSAALTVPLSAAQCHCGR